MLVYLISFAAALLATLVLTPAAQALAVRCGIVDCPDGERKLQKRPIPLLGGVAVFGGWWLGLAATMALGLPVRFPAAMPQGVLTMAALSLVGVWDDAWNLRARWKLLAQVLAALPIAFSGCALGSVEVFGYSLQLGAWGPPATVLWLVLGINALNLIDGMDGMASLTGLSICLGAAALDLYTGGHDVAMFALGLGGSLAGFLVFNFPPAKIYLGDAGSMVIGLAVALATLRVARAPSGVTQLTPMLALMALPLADTVLAVVRRSLSGRGIWNADRGHVHHRLLDRGFSARQVLALVALVSLVMSSMVLLCSNGAGELWVWTAGGALGCLAVRWRLAGHHEWALVRKRMPTVVRNVPLPELADLQNLSLEAAFDRLRAALPGLQVERIRLSLRSVDGELREHEWELPNRDRLATGRTVVQVNGPSHDAAKCSVRIEFPSGEFAGRWHLLEPVLGHFVQFWSKRPEAVPLSGFRRRPAILAVAPRGEQSRAA